LPGDVSASDPQAFLEGVACTAVGSCVAVGRYLDASGATQGLVEQLSGGVWAPSRVALPGDAVATGTSAYAQLSAVACPAAGSCTAVGLYSPSAGGEQALIDTQVGGNWSSATAPLPVAASGSQFLSLACPADGSCVAAGTYLVGGNHLGLIDSLSGGVWTGSALPVPPGTSSMASIVNNDLAVSCPSVGSCVIAGTTFDGNYEGLLDTLSAGMWTATPVSTPNGPSTDVQLTSVACTDPNTCVATGLDQVSGVEQGLIESLASGTWTPSQAPTPAGTPAGANIEMYNVACPSAGTCVADGQSDVAGSQNGLFWNLSAGTWVVTPAPLPGDASAASDPSFAPISCPAAGVCLAVGTYLGSTGREGVIETDPSLAATTTTVSLNAVSGQIVYSAAVTGGAGPTGTVVFSAGLSALCAATVSNGTATCTGPIPPTKVVLGSYSGDGTSAPSWGTAASPAAPSAIIAVWGSGQITKVNTFFPYQLAAKVVDNTGAGVPGVAVTFVAPTTRATAIFWGSHTAITNAAGIAWSPVLSANSVRGWYWVVATTSGVPSGATFLLGNKKLGIV
jgi:adhesin/invasin